ncbi:OLC1v1030243C1 [Oldenlandia corymbosa var. corymbosa]|uniref:OLC1v1030243C1 n=1 Tax=Oldenlandia corymbosa var. corymbosa TaxID=529605 RepID=A0AAV1CIN5_OLDCO|nr:OLC1v1030243C1 [Oldenlandia corymbosa var. corymbosa]
MATKISTKTRFPHGAVFLIIFLLLLQPHVSCSRKLLPASADPHSSADPPTDNNGLQQKSCKFDKMFNLGDASSDTGNRVRENQSEIPCSSFPYGITLGRPTGRCSNGLLMIDYFARAFGLPYLNPYEADWEVFDNGVNFAVAGATALPVETLQAKGLPSHKGNTDYWLGTIGIQSLHIATKSSLSVQIERMSTYFNKTCKTRAACKEYLQNSVFFVGNIGETDFNFAFFGLGGSEFVGLTREIVKSIMEGVRAVIRFGATKVIVPGRFPIGCLPMSLNYHNPAEDSPSFYDSNQCLKGYNSWAAHHNEILKVAIEDLKREHPDVTIVYADYYNAYLSLLTNAEKLGFENKFSASCRSGDRFNFSFDKTCGKAESCSNPESYISWDGFTTTQQANKFMVDYLLDSIMPQLNCSS